MLQAITPVAAEPVQVEAVKGMLRIDDDVFDAQLPLLIATAREIVERQTGRALVAATYEWSPPHGRRAPLPLLPATVTSAEGAWPITLTTEAPPVVPSALVTAIVFLVGEMIMNPDASAPDDLVVNPAFTRLIWPFRRMYA